jgi:uncharacterized membrane protein
MLVPGRGERVAAAGMVFALRLSWIEELVLAAWCVYCVISQIVIALIPMLAAGWFTCEYWKLKQAEKTA